MTKRCSAVPTSSVDVVDRGDVTRSNRHGWCWCHRDGSSSSSSCGLGRREWRVEAMVWGRDDGRATMLSWANHSVVPASGGLERLQQAPILLLPPPSLLLGLGQVGGDGVVCHRSGGADGSGRGFGVSYL